MKILVITQYYYPEDFRINSICERLAKDGHQITVLTGLPNYPEGEIFDGFQDSYKNIEFHNGVRIIRCKIKPRHQGKIRLLINYYSFVKSANKRIKRMDADFDLVFVYQLSPIMCAYPGIKYKKMHGTPLIYYVCDIWPAGALDLDESRFINRINPIYLFARHISRKTYKKADYLITKCNAFEGYLSKICKVNPSKCKTIFEHAENNYLSVNNKPDDNGVIDFVFLGSFARSSNCCSIIEAAAMIEGNYKIHFVGHGSDYEKMVNLTKKYALSDKIMFHGRVPQSDVIKYYNLADVCLLTLSSNSSTGLTPPGKLFSYLASSRPIIGAIDGEAGEIIKESKSGFICKPDSPQSLAEIMQKIINNPSLLDGLGSNGRKFFNSHFTLDIFIKEFESFIVDFVATK